MLRVKISIKFLEMMEIPDGAQMGQVQREQQHAELGPFYTGRAKVPISIRTKEEETTLRTWSHKRGHSEIVEWCDIKLYATIPALHECWKCKNEGRKVFRGHHEDWCRINRNSTQPKTIETKPVQDPMEKEEKSSGAEVESESQVQANEVPSNEVTTTKELEKDAKTKVLSHVNGSHR